IENGVVLINNTVNDPAIGLNEIKNEIRLLERIGLRTISNVTSGPVTINGSSSNFIITRVLNTTSSDQTVLVKVFNINTTPSSLLISQDLPISALSANQVIYANNSMPNFSVEIFNMTAGLYPTAIQASSASLGGLISATDLKTADFVPLLGNGLEG
ncbi:MAG: hypothetical protein H6Q74_3187, partial [Firmicutes bacterium]|nr:hypothetical protein [Bacillota bacterium]